MYILGANAGYGWSAEEVLGSNTLKFKGVSPACGFGGAQIGYDWEGAHHFLLGVEADLQAGGLKDSGLAGGQPVKSNLDWFGTVRGRVGYVARSTLVYVTGGAAAGNVDDEAVATARAVLFKSNETRAGYVVGLGIEHKSAPTWSIKAEYQYLNFGSKVPVNAAGSPISQVVWQIRDDAFHTVRVGLNYHFG